MLKIFYLKVSDYAACSDACFINCLGKDFRTIIDNYKNNQVRRRKLLSETMLRRQLREVFGLLPDHYSITRGEHGKPYIQETPFPVYYNLSHSGDYIICALSRQEVGIDIEQKGKVRMEVARRFFHPHEIERLESLKAEELNELFFGYWSVKESYLKYTGTGLSASLSGFEVCFTTDGIYIRKDQFQEQVYIKECFIDKDYKCFVCSPQPEDIEICLLKNLL